MTATLQKVRVTVPHTHDTAFHAVVTGMHLAAEDVGSDENGTSYEIGLEPDQLARLRAALAAYPGIQIG